MHDKVSFVENKIKQHVDVAMVVVYCRRHSTCACHSRCVCVCLSPGIVSVKGRGRRIVGNAIARNPIIVEGFEWFQYCVHPPIVNYLCTEICAVYNVLLGIHQSCFVCWCITVEFCKLSAGPLDWVIERLSRKIRLVDFVRRTLSPISVELHSTLWVMLLTTLYLIFVALKGSLCYLYGYGCLWTY